VVELRPSSRGDDDDVLRVLAAREARDFGVANFIRGFLLERWREQRFDPVADAVVARDGDIVVGYGGLFEHGALVFVDPGCERQGIGSRLRDWAEALAVERRRSHHRQVIAHGNAGAHALLAAAGYVQVRSVIQMAKSMEATASAPAPPTGITLAPLELPEDGRALHLADTASFAGNADYAPSSFESSTRSTSSPRTWTSTSVASPVAARRSPDLRCASASRTAPATWICSPWIPASAVLGSAHACC
jgi:GNAT superfamily N-acetyltransferase